MLLNSLTMVAVNFPCHLLLMATIPAWMCLLHRPPTGAGGWGSFNVGITHLSCVCHVFGGARPLNLQMTLVGVPRPTHGPSVSVCVDFAPFASVIKANY